MVITLLAITGFQAYWLKNNYDRENRSLEIKTNIAFQETVRGLQAAKLNLKEPGDRDTSHKAKMRIFVDDEDLGTKMNISTDGPRKEIVTMVNGMRDKLMDSARKLRKENTHFFITLKKDSLLTLKDSIPPGFKQAYEKNHVIRYLYGIDSLQDSLRIPELTASYGKTLKEENIVIPFSIHRLDSAIEDRDTRLNDITVGFAHPVTYHLALGNRMPYLMKKITQPILFSIFLVGVTVLCFVVFYRNLRTQQRLTAIKNDFISNITHELKTPIATVSVAIEALKNFNALDDPQKTKEYLDISSNELQRLSLLVDKVLKLSMFEKREIALQKEKFDLVQLAQEVAASMRLQFEKNNAYVTVKATGINFIIEADKLHLTSVIYNLLDNALKYSKEDPQITVHIIDQTQYIDLRVEDNGIGIAPEYRRKIFERFFRVPAGDIHNIKGYGLGLSYVFHIAVRHHGFAEVESELGKGSVFSVKLPFAEAPVIDYGNGRRVFRKAIKIGRT